MELLQKAGDGDSSKAPPELVAVFAADRHTGPLFSVAISPDGRTLAYAPDGKVVSLIDLATGKPRRTLTWDLRFPDDHVYSLAFSPDGKVLACAGNQKTIFLWDADTGKERGTLGGPGERLTQIAFSPDGTLLASAGLLADEIGLVRVWNVAAGRVVFSAATPDSWPAWCVTFSPDGKTLAAGLESGEVRLWDLASGWEVANLTGQGGRVRWVGFHPDGRSLVATGSWRDHTVCLWDLAARQLRRRLPGHLF
jgi:WD40 repeat protein